MAEVSQVTVCAEPIVQTVPAAGEVMGGLITSRAAAETVVAMAARAKKTFVAIIVGRRRRER